MGANLCLREISQFTFTAPACGRYRGSERGSSLKRDKTHVCTSGRAGYLLDSEAVAMDLNCFECDACRER